MQKIVDYFLSSKAELEKVSWPSKKDTIRYSSLVVAVSIIVAVFFAVLDAGLGKSVTAVIERGRTTPASTPSAQTAPTTQPTLNPNEIEGVTADGKTVPIKVTPIK